MGQAPEAPALTDHSFLRDKTLGRDKADTPVAPRSVSPSGFSSLKLQGRAFFVRPLFFLSEQGDQGLDQLRRLEGFHQGGPIDMPGR